MANDVREHARLEGLVTGLRAITPYGAGGGSSRVRIYEWLDHLDLPHRLSNYVGAGNASPRALLTRLPQVLRAERALRQLDLTDQTLLLHREASPLSRGRLEQSLLNRARWSIYDFDDALHWDTAPGLRSAFPKPVKTEHCVRSADLVVAGSDILADWACHFSGEVCVVPSCVEPGNYLPKANYDLGDPPVVGWVGSPSTETHLGLVERPLLELHRRTGARLVVVSSGSRSLGLLDSMVTRVDWTSETVSNVLALFDIAIAPLADQLYARGKCAYKTLQYAASALPAVGSPVGANREVLGRLGFASALGTDEWLEAVTSLLAAPATTRCAIGQEGRDRVNQYYSYSAWAPVMRLLLNVGSSKSDHRPAQPVDVQPGIAVRGPVSRTLRP